MRILISALLICLALPAFSQAKPHAPKEAPVSGIVFFQTRMLEKLSSFYTDQVGCKLWLEQADCKIFRFGNMLFGFCQRDQAPPGGLITFFYPERKQVDQQYEKFKSIAEGKPKDNKKYQIYHFFAKDPEGRMIEFQYFVSKIDWDFERF